MKALWDNWKSRRDLTLNEFLDDNNVWNKFQVETGEALTMEMLNMEISRRERNNANKEKENRPVQQEMQQAPVETQEQNNASTQEQNNSTMFLPNVPAIKV